LATLLGIFVLVKVNVTREGLMMWEVRLDLEGLLNDRSHLLVLVRSSYLLSVRSLRCLGSLPRC
jgi:hypothetical protein